MVGDEQSSPWLPVNPPSDAEDGAVAPSPAPAPTLETPPSPEPGPTPGSEPTPAPTPESGPTPEPAPASAAPWVAQDWSAPSAPAPAAPVAPATASAPPSTGQIPRVPNPDDPFTEQPTMSQFAAPATPATQPWDAEPHASEPPPVEAPAAATPAAESPATPPAPAAEPPVAAPRSPYLTGELPRATDAPARPSFFQAQASVEAPASAEAAPPATPTPASAALTPTPSEAWANPQAQRAEPFEPAPREFTSSAAEPAEPELTPARPVVPGTGSIPIVAEPSTDPVPVAAPDTPASGTLVPEPIDVDDDDLDVVPPIEPPPAEEILPTIDSGAVATQSAWTWDAGPAPQAPPADPVRDLGTSAVSAASLQAAGAPTPASGIPLSELEDVPDFGADEPFVPRFEPPSGYVAAPPAPAPFAPVATPTPTPTPTPSVSFQPPAPKFIDPLSQLEVPTSDEPAYVPELAASAEGPATSDGPATSEGPASDALPGDDADADAPDEFDDATVQRGSGPATPLEGWPYRHGAGATGTPATGTPATGTPATETLEAGTLEAETPAPEDAPTEPTPAEPSPTVSNPYAALAPRDIDADDVEQAPFTPLAPERFDDILAAAPLPAPEAANDSIDASSDDPGARPWASVLDQTQRGEATSFPEAAPASAGSGFAPPGEAPTVPTPVSAPAPSVVPAPQNDASPRVASTEDGPDGGFAGAPATTVEADSAAKGRMSRTRLILIIVAAALVAGVLGVLVYRTYLLPEPVTLPTPTVTAEARVPEGEPIDIAEEASAFLSAIPREVGVDVLMAYESIDPVGDTTLPARAAEHIKLSYGSGAGEPAFTVHAYQHYNVEDAQLAYDAYAAGAPDVADVTVDGDVVGQRAFGAASADGQVAWRNGTAVFVLTGPASELLHFYERFGV